VNTIIILNFFFFFYYYYIFIYFIINTASDRCQNEKRKTINGEDILWAMQSLGFENYCETLKVYLHKYREVNYSIIIK